MTKPCASRAFARATLKNPIPPRKEVTRSKLVNTFPHRKVSQNGATNGLWKIKTFHSSMLKITEVKSFCTGQRKGALSLTKVDAGVGSCKRLLGSKAAFIFLPIPD